MLGYFFAPSLVCLIGGQTSLFALLGLVLFLRLHQTRPFLAGASLWLCALKPHLFLAFGVVLLAWIIGTRGYRIVLGGVSALAASCAATYLIAPHAWAQYSQMVQNSNFKMDFIPCISFLLRYSIKGYPLWAQYILPALGSVWALGYYWRRRTEWDWLRHGNLLLLVSLLTAPYIWLYDQALALPAILDGVFNSPNRVWLGSIALIGALLELAVLCGLWFHTAPFLWTIWSAPAWLIWYLLLNARLSKPRQGCGCTAIHRAECGWSGMLNRIWKFGEGRKANWLRGKTGESAPTNMRLRLL